MSGSYLGPQRLLAVAAPGEARAHILNAACALKIPELFACGEAPEAVDYARSGMSIIVVDTGLPREGAVSVAQAMLAVSPSPIFIAVDTGAPRRVLFTLVELGVRRFLEHGFSTGELRDCVEAMTNRSSLRSAASAIVGRTSLRDAQQEVRETMLRVALTVSEGSRRRAAKILGVTRPAVQRMLRESGFPKGSEGAEIGHTGSLEEWHGSPKNGAICGGTSRSRS